MTLHEVRGYETLRRSLARARIGDGLPATILMHGPIGTGKRRLALWLAQLLLCDDPDASGPCGTCHACRLALRVEHPDLHWYFPLARPSGARSPTRLARALEEARIDAIAEFRAAPLRAPETSDGAIYLEAARSLRASAHRRPSMGERQVYIVSEADALVPQESSPEAANSLLKLLEEPPAGTTFVLTSSEPGLLLPTIRSRALPLYVGGLSEAAVEDILVELAGADEEAAARAARLSQGSVGRALGFLDDDGEPGPLEQLRDDGFSLLEAVLSKDVAAGYRLALEFKPWGARGLVPLLASLDEWLRDLAAVAVGSDCVLNADRAQDLRALLEHRPVRPTEASRALARVEEARLAARGNVNPQLLVAGLVEDLRRILAGEQRGASRVG